MTEHEAPSGHRSLAPIVGTAVGASMLLFGIWGVFANSGQTKPFELARWVVALDLAHDLVAAPLAAALLYAAEHPLSSETSATDDVPEPTSDLT